MQKLTKENFSRSKIKEAISDFTHKQKVIFAVYCAELVLEIYENKNESKAPRFAIKAAKEWIESSTEENKQKCKAAADAADADAADAAADAAAYAASYTAYAAAADAAAAAYAAAAAAYAADAAADADAAAAYAAYAAAKNKIRQKIIDKINEIKLDLSKIKTFVAGENKELIEQPSIESKVLTGKVSPTSFLLLSEQSHNDLLNIKAAAESIKKSDCEIAKVLMREVFKDLIDELDNKVGE